MAGQNASDEQQVRQLEPQWIEAFLRGDTETLDRILADDFIFPTRKGNSCPKLSG